MFLKKLSVLYVEDELMITQLMQELLEDEVSALYIAHDGEEGLRMYDEHQPDIVISDIYMPKLDGLGMSEQIKKKSPDQPVVLLTAFNNIDDLKRAIKIGIDQYISKPIQSRDDLLIPLMDIAQKLREKHELQVLSNSIEEQSKYAAVGEVIGLITHEWRQPLSALMSEITHIQIRHELEDLSEDDVLTFMDQAAERIMFLSNTISHFRDYLKPSEEIQEFELSSVFTQLNSLAGARLHQEKVTLILPEGACSIRGYRNKLLHVLLNLINNACDALSKNGSEGKYIFVSVEEEGDYCIISVKDSAGGIAPEEMNSIFNAHFSTKSKEDGGGYGLYMSRHFAAVHMGGNLEVCNESYTYKEHAYTGAKFTLKILKELDPKR